MVWRANAAPLTLVVLGYKIHAPLTLFLIFPMVWSYLPLLPCSWSSLWCERRMLPPSPWWCWGTRYMPLLCTLFLICLMVWRFLPLLPCSWSFLSLQPCSWSALWCEGRVLPPSPWWCWGTQYRYRYLPFLPCYWPFLWSKPNSSSYLVLDLPYGVKGECCLPLLAGVSVEHLLYHGIDLVGQINNCKGIK